MFIGRHLDAAARTLAEETDYSAAQVREMADCVHSAKDIGATLSSGSFKTLGMLVAPCSIKTLSGNAHSYNDELVVRAADVCWKERRRVVLLLRETPLHAGHIALMAQATQNGAVIMPPVPAFYSRPATVQAIVDQTVGRALDLFGLDVPGTERWDGGARGTMGGGTRGDTRGGTRGDAVTGRATGFGCTRSTGRDHDALCPQPRFITREAANTLLAPLPPWQQASARICNPYTPENESMKNALIALAIAFVTVGAHAQAGTAVKEAGKATAETAKQGAESTKAATSSQPEKSVHKVKAKVHKAKAKKAATASKNAAKEAVK